MLRTLLSTMSSNNNSSFQWNSANNNNNNSNSNNSNNNVPNFVFSNNSSARKDQIINPMMDISHLHNQYAAQHPECRFETILYNKIPSTMNVKLFDKPPLIRTQIWDRGITNNPYPNKLVPVGIRGYVELNQRSNLCLAGHCTAIKSFQQISEKINILKDEVNIKNKQCITDLKQTQIHQSHRLLAIMRAYIAQMTNDTQSLNDSTLTVRSHNANDLNMLSAKEMKLRNVLNQMKRESKQLINAYGRINKLSYDLDIESRGEGVLLSVEGDANDVREPVNGFNNHPNQKNMNQMFGFLKQQQMFMQLLSNTVQSDIKDLDVIQNGIQSVQQNNSPQNNTSVLLNQNYNSMNSSAIYG
eukprot:592500_1